MTVFKNPYDDPEFVNLRLSQKDPIIQYYIVKESLNLSTGKIAAQCSHAAMMFTSFYFEERKEVMSKSPKGGEKLLRTELISRWMEQYYRKIVLKAKDSKFETIKEKFDCFVVTDAGLTETDSGSETVLVLFPMYKSKVPKILSRLRLL